MAKKIPLRQCVGCGEMKGKKEMLRVLKTPEDEICLQKARKNKGLERSFKMSISPEVYDTLEKEFDQLETE